MLNFRILLGVGCRSFAAVQKRIEDESVVHCDLESLGFSEMRVVRQASLVAAFPIRLLSSTSRDRLSVMVDPR